MASLFKRSVLLMILWPLLWGGSQVSGMQAWAAPAAFTVLAVGDSLTAGYGLTPAEAFPAQLQAMLREKGLKVEVKNAGVSGDTTADGLSRLGWLVEGANPKPDLIILEFGANDALRGIDPAITRANLDKMLGYLGARKLRVLFVGMKAPPNMGKVYTAEFNAIYPDLAKKHRVAFDPFFLEGVAGRPKLNQKDGMHPNALGVERVISRLAPRVIALLQGGAGVKTGGK